MWSGYTVFMRENQIKYMDLFDIKILQFHNFTHYYMIFEKLYYLKNLSETSEIIDIILLNTTIKSRIIYQSSAISWEMETSIHLQTKNLRAVVLFPSTYVIHDTNRKCG